MTRKHHVQVRPGCLDSKRYRGGKVWPYLGRSEPHRGMHRVSRRRGSLPGGLVEGSLRARTQAREATGPCVPIRKGGQWCQDVPFPGAPPLPPPYKFR